MLISMIVAMLFGGGAQNLAVSQEDYRHVKAQVMEVMQDIEQRQEVIQVLYGLKRNGRKYGRRYVKQYKPIIRELRQYDGTYDKLDVLLMGSDTVRREWNEEVLRTRFEIRELMTREEWEVVFGLQ